MVALVIEQARLRRADTARPAVLTRSPGFRDDWLAEAERLVIGFGIRPAGQAVAQAVFAAPFGAAHVAVVQVADRGEPAALSFHLLVLPRADYERVFGDPFALARTYAADWSATSLQAVSVTEPLPQRTLAQVQRVLMRVKAGALKEGEDPEHPEFQRTQDNSESPALLGGVQVLVDGGKLVFERPRPDLDLVAGLWTLLPQSTRAKLWPASFAFASTLGFDAVVVPRVHVADYEGYTSEEQAADYPPGTYEMNLQVAAESGDARAVEALLNRRSGAETFKLGWILLVAIVLLVLAPGLIELIAPSPAPPAPPAIDRAHKAATAAGIVAGRDPWLALGLKFHGDSIWLK